MVQFLPHARKRMRQRNISECEVRYCLQNPEVTYSDKKGNPIYVTHTSNGRRIKVVVLAGTDPTTILTVAD